MAKPLRNNKKPRKYWSIEVSKTAAGENSAELFFYGTISDEKWFESDVTPNELASKLNALGNLEELNVHIFSNGGDVFAGNAIYALLKQRKEVVNVYIEGIAASIASVIAMAGDNVYIAKNAMLMIHNPMLGLDLWGLFNRVDINNQIEKLKKLVIELDRIRDVTTQAYTDKTGLSDAKINAMLDANDGDGTYLDAAQAVELGFADAITPDAKAPLDAVAMIKPNIYSFRGYKIDLTMYHNLPKLAAAVKTARNGGSKRMAIFKKPAVRMAKRRKPTARKSKKFRAEIMPIECPHCHAMLDLDTSNDPPTLSVNPAEDATVAVPLEGEVQAVRRGKFKNELFKLTCPICAGEFDYETDPDAGEVIVDDDDYSPDEPIIAAKRKRTSANRKKAHASRRKHRMQAEQVKLTCTECGTDFEVEVDPEIVKAVVECPGCGAELTVDTSDVGSDDVPPDSGDDTPSDPNEDVLPDPNEDEIDIVAYRKGVKAERKRTLQLSKRMQEYPQYANAIAGFIKNGSSIQAANNWILQALSSGQKNSSYSAAASRDATSLGRLGYVTATNNREIRIADMSDRIAKARGVKTNG